MTAVGGGCGGDGGVVRAGAEADAGVRPGRWSVVGRKGRQHWCQMSGTVRRGGVARRARVGGLAAVRVVGGGRCGGRCVVGAGAQADAGMRPVEASVGGR